MATVNSTSLYCLSGRFLYAAPSITVKLVTLTSCVTYDTTEAKRRQQQDEIGHSDSLSSLTSEWPNEQAL